MALPTEKTRASVVAAFVKEFGRAPSGGMKLIDAVAASQDARDPKTGDGKDRPSLLPWDAVQRAVAVMEGGAAKYGPRSWEHGDSDKYMNALMRHAMAILAGEVLDPESGEPHIDHISCNALIVSYLQSRGK